MVFEISRINIGSTWQNIAHDVIVGVRPFDSPKTWPFHLSKIFLWLFKQILKLWIRGRDLIIFRRSFLETR